jgi:hypothetical protein
VQGSCAAPVATPQHNSGAGQVPQADSQSTDSQPQRLSGTNSPPCTRQHLKAAPTVLRHVAGSTSHRTCMPHSPQPHSGTATQLENLMSAAATPHMLLLVCPAAQGAAAPPMRARQQHAACPQAAHIQQLQARGCPFIAATSPSVPVLCVPPGWHHHKQNAAQWSKAYAAQQQGGPKDELCLPSPQVPTALKARASAVCPPQGGGTQHTHLGCQALDKGGHPRHCHTPELVTPAGAHSCSTH